MRDVGKAGFTATGNVCRTVIGYSLFEYHTFFLILTTYYNNAVFRYTITKNIINNKMKFITTTVKLKRAERQIVAPPDGVWIIETKSRCRFCIQISDNDKQRSIIDTSFVFKLLSRKFNYFDH